jgi:biopolymer transport protein ExbD
MISRPLDLASKLRPEPRNFDFLFFVNGGLIILCFTLFGSRFVLSPGLGIDFQLPEVPGAVSGATQTTHRINVKPTGVIYIEDGPADPERFGRWLIDEAKNTRQQLRQPSLLIIASGDVPTGRIVEIAVAAHAAGFVKVQQAAEEPKRENR